MGHYTKLKRCIYHLNCIFTNSLKINLRINNSMECQFERVNRWVQKHIRWLTSSLESGEKWAGSNNKRVIVHPEKLQGKTELNRLTGKRAERSRT